MSWWSWSLVWIFYITYKVHVFATPRAVSSFLASCWGFFFWSWESRFISLFLNIGLPLLTALRRCTSLKSFKDLSNNWRTHHWSGSTCPEEKMFGFHKPKMYRSIEGCCICRAKSSSSRFTDSKRYEKDFQSCFGLHETRSGDICNACVLLVKRWKKLPAGSKKNWNHVVDARAGPSLKTTLKPKKVKTLSGNRIKSNQISKLQKEFKRHNSDAHSTTSSASPAQSPCYSNQSDDGSDTEMASGSNRTPVFSFLDLTYWKRQKICCGIIYKGRFGEVLIDTHLFKPCCSNKKAAAEKPEEQGPEPLPISTQEWWLRFM